MVEPPPAPERRDVPAQRTDGSPAWVSAVLRLGCFALAVVVVIWALPTIFMMLWAIQEARDDEWRRPQPTKSPPVAPAPAPVCHDLAPEVLARIEAGLTVPDIWLRGARAVDSTRDPRDRYVGADVQGVYFEGDRNIAVWRLTEGDPSDARAAPAAPIFAVNILATQVSSFPIDIDLNASLAPQRCTVAALSGD